MLKGYLQINKRQIPQYQFFQSGMTHLTFSFQKLGKKLYHKKSYWKLKWFTMKFMLIDWRDKKDEGSEDVKNDVQCTVFSYARCSKAMQKNTGGGMRDWLSLPGWGWRYLNSLWTEEDQPIDTYNDNYMR